MPKVSVIIPVYGVENYIERCARSLFEQTLDDIEYIFVDDCTPDKSIEMLESIIEEYRLRFAEEKKTVRIVRMPTNSGLPAVRRHGIQLATGDYVIHCDSDDWVEIDMYQQMYEKAVDDSADVVVCDYYYTDSYTKKTCIGISMPEKEHFISELLMRKVSKGVWNKLIKRNLYSYDIKYPKYNMGEDYVIIIQLLFYSSKISKIEKPLYNYYYNPKSITNNASKESILYRFNQTTANAQILLDFFYENGLKDKYKKEIAYFLYYEKYSIVPLISSFKYYKRWIETFPQTTLQVFFLNCFTLKEKIWHLFNCLGLSPYLMSNKK